MLSDGLVGAKLQNATSGGPYRCISPVRSDRVAAITASYVHFCAVMLAVKSSPSTNKQPVTEQVTHQPCLIPAGSELPAPAHRLTDRISAINRNDLKRGELDPK